MNDIELAAKAAHEVNRAFCAALNDLSQVSWEEAPDWQKNSARVGAQAIFDNPHTTPEQSHEGWLALKQAEGWKYGPIKDVEKKEHPCMLPYAELSPVAKAKDALFGVVVRAVLEH